MKNTILYWIGFGFFVILSMVLGGLYILEVNAKMPVVNNTVIEAQEDSIVATQEQSDVAADQGEKVSFKANVGKFNLNLSNDFVIIVHTDGTYDGVRSTTVEVGRRVTDGVVNNAFNDYVKIEAYPANVNGSRDQFVTTDTILQGSPHREERAKVDGKDARKFIIDSYGETIKYYFERDGITYAIEAWDVKNGDTLNMLTSVLIGFNFN